MLKCFQQIPLELKDIKMNPLVAKGPQWLGLSDNLFATCLTGRKPIQLIPNPFNWSQTHLNVVGHFLSSEKLLIVPHYKRLNKKKWHERWVPGPCCRHL